MSGNVIKLILICTVLLFVAGCTNPNEVSEENNHEHGLDDVHEEDNLEEGDTQDEDEQDSNENQENAPSLGVPAPGHEDVEEMVVKTVSEVKEFDIIARNWEFVPNIIEVNSGDTVKLNVKSIEGTHGFRISGYDINEILELNQEVNIEFVADKEGTFSFSCSVSCGRGHGGMTGQLVVK